MDGQKTNKDQGIQVISRAADILRVLASTSTGMSLGQIARDVNLPRSTVQRIVAALAHEGFVSADNGYGGIKLGPAIQGLARSSNADVRERLRPIMKQIAERTGETVDLAVLDKGGMLFIDQVEGTHRLRTVSFIGETFPLTTTANGKAALACMDQADAAKLVIAELERDPTDTRSLTGILHELEVVRGQGIASDHNEHSDGISALGIAIEDSNGDIYAISTPVPTHRFDRIRPQLFEALSDCLSSFGK